ncbi:hypothetical protein PFY12_14760 [Chryseobacterium camelliae]|uniref:Uncharacterized protein n=1 Tax=Chryseobacterium camelliae TaxID=1265445 RepID=A0ABY7QKU6_9FLAO|nr:hypothetical protein [Chryseobacterium camelliae]WBV60287.1 hypothetical protein PFY12_14760 [Chryseobacterium camelliae]
MSSKKENRNKIMKLHFRNEELYRTGVITYEEYITNNHTLLLNLKRNIFTEEQTALLFNFSIIELEVDRFNFLISILKSVPN